MKEEKSKGLPSDVDQVFIVSRYELRKNLRSKGVVGMLAIIVLVVTLITVLPPLLGNDYSEDAAEFAKGYVDWTELIILVGVVAFACSSLVSEFDKRTGLLIFPQPVKRTTYLLGKFIATMVIVAGAVCLYYIAVVFLSMAIVGEVSTLLPTSLGFAMLYALAMCSMAYMFSSALKTSTAAIILTVLLFLIVMPMVSQMLSMASVDPYLLISNAADAIGHSLEDPYPETAIYEMRRMTLTIYVPPQSTAALVLLGYAVVPMSISALLFRKKEM
jgi:ABC-2 type transport system permease protein